MRRWGYLTAEAAPEASASRPRHQDLLVRATARGLRANAAWEPLTGVIEQRWRDRFGGPDVDGLAGALRQIAGRLGAWLPDCLPILGYRPAGWRASVRPPANLPHFPMVLHRGGYPDGS